ncbi:arogenate dehydrogenase 1 chloroplastic [Prunus yedoensis var. nudiflora]|uniref:Arogenate dehydrogenase 1 chloroplastic n=1 Tax=Prunus yedoensis var. nudiflora TaxID=2094558 RepID=A0A314XRA0_PRUYE|nr:arogenate dehydrogenase 1 chloroplastic [Prunus yedoensis var. nudiflora]
MLLAQLLRQSFEFSSRPEMLSLCPLHPSPPKPSLPPSLSLNPKSFNLFSNASLIRTRSLRPKSLKIQSLDAAQLYDYESKVAAQFHDDHMLKIAIIGFGNYGQFLAKTLVAQGHTVLAHSRSDYSKTAQDLDVSFFSDPHDLCEQHPQVILLCTSILSTEPVLKSLPLQRLRRNTLVVDVLSVKEFSKALLLKLLPGYFDVVCTHPMFGPQSAKHGWNGLFFVYEKVRIGSEESRISRCDKLLNIFEKEGCRMVEMSCAEHDKYAAGSQFMTHTLGRVLGMLKLESTPINTKGYETLLDLVENTAGDSFDLYYGLFMYNKNALETLERLDLAFEALKKQLFGHLHDVVRKQLFGNAEKARTLQEDYAKQAQNGAALVSSSKALRSPKIVRSDDQKAQISDDNSRLKIAIVGFGNFGQFLAKTIVRQGHTVLAFSRTDYSDVAQKLGVSYFSDADDLCEEHPEVILLCTSILSTEKVLRSLPLQRLKRNTLFVDVLSVKEFPRNLFLQTLPLEFDILCTHPMFGPESGKNGGMVFLLFMIRSGLEVMNQGYHGVINFLISLHEKGAEWWKCLVQNMICMQQVHNSLHTLWEGFWKNLGLESTPINTKGYETLLNLVENTAGDSFDLYYGLFMYNINAMEQLKRLDMAFESLKKQLFGRLHGVLRKQLFENADKSQVMQEQALLPKPSQNESALTPSLEALNIQKN